MKATITLIPDQVYEIVRELQTADYHRDGLSYFDERVERLKEAGWVLGVEAYQHKLFKGRRGKSLRHPRYEWRNAAHFYNAATAMRVFYWDNDGYSKHQANDFAQRTPVPLSQAGPYATFSKSTTH